MKEFNIDSSKLQMETEEKTSSMFDFDKIKMVFVLHWKWFIPSVVICLLIAVYYLWVTPTTISVTGKMLLIDKNIHFYTINAGAATPFNMGSVNATSSTMGGSAVTSTSSGASQNYLVSNDGTINFPILGRIKVVGLTKDECEDMILEKIRPYMAESERLIVTVVRPTIPSRYLVRLALQAPSRFPVRRLTSTRPLPRQATSPSMASATVSSSFVRMPMASVRFTCLTSAMLTS